jgi:calpain-7
VTDFLTPFLHRNVSSEDLILYPSTKTCVFSGAYTNSPHILARYDIEGPRDKFLSVVLSRYHKSKDLGYTLSCYCTGSFTLSSPIKTPSHVIRLSSEWTDSTSGGNPSNSSFNFNPMWSVMLPKGGAQIQLKCYAPKTIFINVKLIRSISDSNARESLVINSRTAVVDTGDYRDGFVASAVKLVSEGSYVLVASTFDPGEIGPFMLNIHSSIKGIHVSQL